MRLITYKQCIQSERYRLFSSITGYIFIIWLTWVKPL